jgi:hypothetical protein
MVQALNIPGSINVQFVCPYAEAPSETRSESETVICQQLGGNTVLGNDFNLHCNSTKVTMFTMGEAAEETTSCSLVLEAYKAAGGVSNDVEINFDNLLTFRTCVIHVAHSTVKGDLSAHAHAYTSHTSHIFVPFSIIKLVRILTARGRFARTLLLHTAVRYATKIDSGEKCGFICPPRPGIAEFVAVCCVFVILFGIFVAARFTYAWRWATKQLTDEDGENEDTTTLCSAIVSKVKWAKQNYDANIGLGGRW